MRAAYDGLPREPLHLGARRRQVMSGRWVAHGATARRAKSQARSAVVMSVACDGGALPLKSILLVATLWPTPRQLEFR